ncbi:MAG: alpha/beta hydrolase [Bacillota bacterium]
MLQYEIGLPRQVQDGAPVVVLLHGRGSHMGDLMGLRPYLPEEMILVAPQAPFPGQPWGYGPGWAWYRFLGRNRPEPESFAAGQEALEEFLRELPGRLPVQPGPLALGGFSQGGTMSLAYALRNPGRVAHCINLSGFLADHPSVRLSAETVRGTRFFWGHGTADPAIPFDLAVEGRAQLRSAGADLTEGTYRMGHSISTEEIQDLVRWLTAPL